MELVLHNVKHVPDMRLNIISTGLLDEDENIVPDMVTTTVLHLTVRNSYGTPCESRRESVEAKSAMRSERPQRGWRRLLLKNTIPPPPPPNLAAGVLNLKYHI
nr:hypothetical protein [Tanacetum cinerariifolium]